MQDMAVETKIGAAPEPNTEDHLKLAEEMKHRGNDARLRSDFHHTEAMLFRSVADACDAALDSLNRPQADGSSPR